MPDDLKTITIDQLRIGLYVHLDLKWFEHPFAFNNFRIKGEDQIKTIRGLGLKTVRYDPARSEVKPPPPQPSKDSPKAPPAAAGTAETAAVAKAASAAVAAAVTEAAETVETVADAASATDAGAATGSETAATVATAKAADAMHATEDTWAADSAQAAENAPATDAEQEAAAKPTSPELPALAAKRALIERIKQQREAAERIGNAFVNTANTIRDVEKNLLVKPAETVRQASQLITQIADSILSAPELAIHVMGENLGGEDLYFHSLNVTMLSLMMARDIKLPPELVTPLGMGALFHDVGRREIPSTILMKMDPLSTAERNLYELHCQYGVDIGKRLQLQPPVLGIIREHHEFFDGSGYPARLKGEAISLLARIVVITNHYDELCNPVNIANALTPHEALSFMFAKARAKFDPKLLQVFVRCLGVYPPGTIVQLSNGAIGMVATINTAKPLKPTLVIYDAEVPKEEAILVDMNQETDVNIAKAIRPAQLPREIYNYLSPRKQVSYYFDAGTPGKDKSKS